MLYLFLFLFWAALIIIFALSVDVIVRNDKKTNVQTEKNLRKWRTVLGMVCLMFISLFLMYFDPNKMITRYLVKSGGY